MPTDTGLGKICYTEDFLVTAIGDLPEVDVLSAAGVTTAILANQPGGVVEIPVATSNDNDKAAVSTNLNWFADANGMLIGEARVKWDTSVADMFWFIGFGDSLASTDELSWDVSGDTYTPATMSDTVGFHFNNDATTPRVVAVCGKADATTYSKILSDRFTPAVDVYHTYRVEISPGATMIEWSIDGEIVARALRAPGDTTSYITVTAPLCFAVENYEQGTANEIEVDYMRVEKFRRYGDNATISG